MRSGTLWFFTCKRQVLLALSFFITYAVIGQRAATIQFVYTSDANYGLARSHFQGDTK